MYIEKPKGFQLLEDKDYLCRLKKELYILKQAHRAWYLSLGKYQQQEGFKRGVGESNLYIKFENENMIIIVVYVYASNFGSNMDSQIQTFEEEM